MSYSQPPEPNPYPQQSWTDPHGRGWPGGPPPVEPPRGAGLGAAALLLGLVGCVVPLLPVNLDQIRAYSPFPFALPGLALAIVGCTGNRRGKPAAAIGAVFCAIALLLGMFMVVNRT
jgi:hypothetical protein